MLTDVERAKLEDLQFMMGTDAGALAFALEQITDAMAQVGQHKVYCRVEKGPREGEPPLDVVELLNTLDKAKALVQGTVGRLRADRRGAAGPG
jgi:hypothetical protein